MKKCIRCGKDMTEAETEHMIEAMGHTKSDIGIGAFNVLGLYKPENETAVCCYSCFEWASRKWLGLPEIHHCPSCNTELVKHSSAGRGQYRDRPNLLVCPSCWLKFDPDKGMERVKKVKRRR